MSDSLYVNDNGTPVPLNLGTGIEFVERIEALEGDVSTLNAFKTSQSTKDAQQDAAISAAQTAASNAQTAANNAASAASNAQSTANQKLDMAGGFVSGDVTMRGTLTLEPLTGEGGQFLLNAAADDMTSGSLLFDTAWGAFRVFGLPSRDGVTHPNLGAGFVWDPHTNQLIVGDKHVVRSVNGALADATGNVPLSNITAMACSNVYAFFTKNSKPVLPSGGTWTYFGTNYNSSYESRGYFYGTSSGGSSIGYNGHEHCGIAIRIA